jgi:hypothetical protein
LRNLGKSWITRVLVLIGPVSAPGGAALPRPPIFTRGEEFHAEFAEFAEGDQNTEKHIFLRRDADLLAFSIQPLALLHAGGIAKAADL